VCARKKSPPSIHYICATLHPPTKAGVDSRQSRRLFGAKSGQTKHMGKEEEFLLAPYGGVKKHSRI